MLAGVCRVWVKVLAGVWVACQWVCQWAVTGQKCLPVMPVMPVMPVVA